MTQRILPESHHYAVCSEADIPIKNFYAGYYPEIFICLHPFLKPVGISSGLFNPDSWPNKAKIRENCQSLSWTDFSNLAEIDSIHTLDVGLRTRILGLAEQSQNLEAAGKIDKGLELNNLISPQEGAFPEILFDKWLTALTALGHQWVWLGDEHCTERRLHFIQDLLDQEEMPNNRNMFTHMNEILFSVHWDSHFTLICGKKSEIEKIISVAHLEGFYCTEKTEIYWSLQP